MKIYGLTGGIASGKSTVATILNKELHINIIDADSLSREAVKYGSMGLHMIVEEFGREILQEDKSLNRSKLGELVFGNKTLIKRLNDIVHPEVDKLFRELVKKYKDNGCRVIVYDCPLLIEENLMNNVDEIVLVITSKELQLERLMNRNSLTNEEALRRIKMQMNMEDKISYSDYVIYNDGIYDELKTAVIHLWNCFVE